MPLIAALAVAGAAAIGAFYGLPVLAKVFWRRRFLAQIQRSGQLCLTFDDGPSPEVTPLLLDTLAAAGVRATFFVTGGKADRHPELIRRMIDEGHQVANHGYDHPHPWRSVPGRCSADLRRGEAAVARNAPEPAAARFVRPPYGKLDLAALIDLWRRRRIVAYWSVDPADYAAVDADAIVARLAGRLNPGEVILLHDGADEGDRPPEVLPAALRAILADIARHDTPTATVAEAWAKTA